MTYKLTDLPEDYGERQTALLAPLQSAPAAWRRKMGKEIAALVLRGEADAQEAGALLLAREVRKVVK